jgi:radical SAM superfamily enzyme YgiQ (UPF0313 family)
MDVAALKEYDSKTPEWAPRKKVENPKVWLVRPPQQFYFGVWPRGPRLSLPLGLLSIGSFLQRAGIDITLYDCFVESETKDQKQLAEKLNESKGSILTRWMRQDDASGVTPFELDEQKKKKKQSGFGFNVRDWINWLNRAESSDRDQDRDDLVYFGASWDKFERDLLEARPDIVGITNQFRENTAETLRTAELVRRILPDATIVVGGPNASALPDQMLAECSAIDIMAIGDGEQTMLDIVQCVRGNMEVAKINSIVVRAGDQNLRTPTRSLLSDLDTLGQINYDLARMERYFDYEKSGLMARQKFDYAGAHRTVSLVTSRGCPYKCSFCSIHIHAGRKYRRYSVEHTLDHIENLVKNYGVRHFHLEDDNLTLDKERFMELMNGVLERGLKFTWDTPNGVFANAIDEEMMHAMKKTGCTYLVIGVESGDQYVLDNIIRKQPLTIDHVLRVFELGKKVGIDLQAFYIIGFPRETMENIRTTVDFALESLKKYDVLPHMAIARPDPGTDMFKEAMANGNLVVDRARDTKDGIHTDTFTRYMVTSDTFTPESIVAVSEEFHKKSIRTITLKSMGYMLRHPVVTANCIGYFIRSMASSSSLQDSVVKLFFCKLFYRNTLLREKAIVNEQTPPTGEFQSVLVSDRV